LSKLSMAATLVLASVLIGAGGGVVWQRVQAGGADPALPDEPAAQAAAQPQQKPKIPQPPAERKPDPAQDVERLERELLTAESEYLRAERSWDERIADERRRWRREDQDR